MFWAITCEAGKRYSQIPTEPFCVTLAALEPKDAVVENKQVSLMIEHKGKEFLLCTLEYDRVMQCPLCLQFDRGEETFFFVNGEGTIHLSGYLLEQVEHARDIAIYTGDCRDQQVSLLKPVESEEGSGGENVIEEDEEVVGTQRLLTLDESNEDDSGDEWTPPDVESKQQKCVDGEKHVDFVDNNVEVLDDDDDDDDSDVMLASDDDESSVEEEEEEEDDSVDEIKEEKISEDEDVQEVTSGKRKQIMPESRPYKRSRDEASTSKKGTPPLMQVINVSSKRKQKLSEEEMNSSIGRTPMPSKKSSFLKSSLVSKVSDTSPLLRPGTSSSFEGSSKSSGKRSIKGDSTSKTSNTSYSHKLPSGVEYDDVRVGNGPSAKKGKFVHLYYVGRLENNSIFDSIKEGSGKPFSFRLGRKEVIPGLDEALTGMQVGGKRLIRIPPHMGYGKKNMGDIPPNSTLLFTVDLKAVT